MAKISNQRATKGGKYLWEALLKAEKYYFILLVWADNKADATNKIKKLGNLCLIDTIRRVDACE